MSGERPNRLTESRLATLLREAPVPDAEGAETRGLALIEAAFEERRPATRRPSLPRLAVAIAVITLLAALLLSPAGADVRDWIGDTLSPGVENAAPGLTDVPGGGRLLVGSPSGPWVVQPDGSRRLLGAYADATWSPHGLFVAAAGERDLNAVAPDGTVRWSLPAAGPVTMPRWSPSGFRIAYRSGAVLRVVSGDNEDDHAIARATAAVPPAWLPGGPHVLAYATDGGRSLRIAEADSGRALATAPSRPGLVSIEWSPNGERLLEKTRRAAFLREVAFGKLAGGVSVGPPRALRLPPGAVVRSASFSPTDGTIAVLVSLPGLEGDRPARSEALLFDSLGERPRRHFTAPGMLSDLAWSPSGSHLLIGWPDADQWLFVPVSGIGEVVAVGGIAEEFDPGGNTSPVAFPRVEGWCCPTG